MAKRSPRSNRSASQSAPKNFRTGKTSEEVSATNSSLARMRQSGVGGIFISNSNVSVDMIK